MAELISYHEALALVLARAKSFGQERVDLDDTLGRVLAETVSADRDFPPFPRAAMDGFAIRREDWEAGLREYQVQETIFAGQQSEGELVSGGSFRIMTGALVPTSANVLIRREDSQENNGSVKLYAKELKPFLNIARQGEDLKQGEQVFAPGLLINASVVGALAALGKETVLVERPPKVALFTTGYEVVPVGQPVSGAQIRNSNQHLLKALLRQWHIKSERCQHLPDEKESIKQALQEVLHHDLILLNGGVSAGDADFVPQVLHELGIEAVFHKVAIKPGKPIFFGELPTGGVVFGLPGNPFSCLVTFTVFVEEFLHRCFGGKGERGYLLPVGEGKVKKHRLTEFFAVRWREDGSGIRPLPHNGSGDIRAGISAQGLAVHPAEIGTVQQGDHLRVIPFGPGT